MVYGINCVSLRWSLRSACAPTQSYQGFLCPHLVLSVAFLTAFGVDSDLATLDLNFSLTVLPLCGRCFASVLLCLRLIPELKCLHSNVYCAKCLFLCKRYFSIILRNFVSVDFDPLDRVKRIWYLSPMRAAKVQASLRIHAVSPEPSLLAHTSSESRGTFRQKARSLAPLNGWACAVEICHDGMLEDTNSLDGAPFVTLSYARVCMYWYNNVTFVICRVTSRYVFINGRDVTCFSKWSLVSEEDKISKL